MKKHWYRIYTEECVLCGRTREYRERVMGKKPKDYRKRYTYTQDACPGHFL